MGLKKRALITGISGQDGSYLAELLLSKGYEVHGMVRRVALEDPERRLGRILHILDRVHLHAAALESPASVLKVVEESQPDECYHLAAQSFVSYSFEDESSTLQTNIIGTQHVLSAIKSRVPNCHFYFAATSEMFGSSKERPQRETTRFEPVSPYAVSKVAGYELTHYYRKAHKIHASCGILFNHESPRRGLEFVTRKITSGVAAILAQRQKTIRLGNLDARRDWGHARDYVEAMWLMLQQPEPGDWVIATGEDHSVRDFVEAAFACVGLDWRDYVQIDPAYFRPAEVEHLVGDASKARRELAWENRTTFRELVQEMVEADCRLMGVQLGRK